MYTGSIDEQFHGRGVSEGKRELRSNNSRPDVFNFLRQKAGPELIPYLGHRVVSDGSSSLGTFMLASRCSYFIHTQGNPPFFRRAIELFDLVRSD